MENSDVGMKETSESSGLPMTLDFLFALMRTEEFDKLGQIMVKQLKSRYNDINYYKRFMVGVDLSKFKLYDVDLNSNSDFIDKGMQDEKSDKFDKKIDLSTVDFS